MEKLKALIKSWEEEAKFLDNPSDSSFDRTIGKTYATCALELSKAIKQPPNKVDADRQKTCWIKHSVYKNLTDLANCPVCGKAFYD